MTLADAVHRRTWLAYFEFWPTSSEIDITEKQTVSRAGRWLQIKRNSVSRHPYLRKTRQERSLILQCWGQMFRRLTTEHRPHSTCPAHSYQQPDPTAPLPPARRGQLCRADVTNFTAQPNFGGPHKTLGTAAHRLQICSSERTVNTRRSPRRLPLWDLEYTYIYRAFLLLCPCRMICVTAALLEQKTKEQPGIP